ncbi:MAG: type II secretion system F family protein [Gammaproteobacteria bacterium]|nr:type II secretion system F family protein [Gammaproteobacteria bacterium]NNF62153.1 type II secretion system F family protein [Gammaproteobacteria bacterium]NNM21844.1 type II secretion system F family protein [Gammaproteobacteria bacterium]
MAESTAVKQFPFNWEGTDRRGKRIKGKTMAASETAVRSELRRQGVMPVKIRKQRTLFSEGKVTPLDIAIFSRQLATMMTSGVPLVQAFDIIGTGNENRAMQKLVLAVKASVEGGTSLAESLGQHPLYFDDLYVNLVAAGEQAGALETLLDKIATYKEKTESIKKKIKKALFYPAAVLVVAFIVTAILLIFVIPQFESMFSGFGADLPGFTLMVINLSVLVRTKGLFMVAVVAAAISAFIFVKKRSAKFRHFLDRVALKLPIIGAILTKAAIARFSRTLSTMFAAGVPLVEALQSVAGATGNIVYEHATLRMKEEVSTGQRLQRSMEDSDLFPNMAVQMIAIGEESGSLDQMSAKVADFFEEEVDTAVDSMSSLLEPLIMGILGILVGGLVVAMYLPIFKMAAVVG